MWKWSEALTIVDYILYIALYMYNIHGKRISFPFRISSVNVTKSAGNYGFGRIY